MTNIVYVDKDDNVVGAGPRAEANERGMGRRIVRIFLYNSKGELLIQKRADTLRYMPGKWDHSAAGHVDEGEDYTTAAYRELKEELGVAGVELREIKKVPMENHEVPGIWMFNMLYTLTYDGPFVPNKGEVAELKWIKPDELRAWMEREPDLFPPGFIFTFKEFSALQKGA